MRIWIRNTALVFLVELDLKGGKIHTTDRDVFKVMLDNEDYAAVKWKFKFLLQNILQVAVKVQYPGVAKSIQSDIRNEGSFKIS